MSNWERWKNIQKCYPFEEKRLAKWQPPYIVQPKYDGVRCRAVALDNGHYILLSSEENLITSVPHIELSCDSQLNGQEFDGELYCHGMSFEEIFSITSRTINLHPNYGIIQFHIFDIVTNDSQAHRIKLLNESSLKPPLIKSPYYICNNLEEIMKVYDQLISDGYEGIIVRHLAAPYERKRSTYAMKFKPKKSDTYEILAYVEEVSINGSPKGQLGSLICDSGDGNNFSVGTGFTEDQRRHLWSIRTSLIGKFAKVQYQHLTSGKKVPRFPVFMEILNKGEEE